MRTLAVGSRAQHGFTLLELLLVVAIVALASLGVALALPDGQQGQLEREAQRLAALLDAARARARAAATPIRWVSDATGFHFESAAPVVADLPRNWLNDNTLASPATITLSAQPIADPQAITLRLRSSSTHSVLLSSDGVRAFTPVPTTASPS